MHFFAHAVLAPLSLVFALVSEVKESVQVFCGLEYDMPSSSAVTAAWPAMGNILLPSEGNTSPSSVAGLYIDFRIINKLHGYIVTFSLYGLSL